MYNPIKTKRRSIAFRERTYRVVDATLVTHTEEAADILNRRWAPDPAISEHVARHSRANETQVTDYRAVFADLGHELQQARREMLLANTVHLGQLAVIVDLQKRRDGLFEGLFSRYFKARHTLETNYGRLQGFEVLAVSGDTPRDPTGLIQQVRQTVEFLRRPKVELPPLDLDGVLIEPGPMATQLGAQADELETVLVDIDRERKNAQTTRKAKNDAIAAFDRLYRWVGQALETYFRLAGMHELAERVRPSGRRPGSRAADDGGEQGSDEPPAEAVKETPEEAPASDSADA